MTTPIEVRNIILNAFIDGWAGQTEVAYDNMEFDPPDGDTAWVRLSVKPTFRTIASLGQEGNRRFRGFGMVIVQVFVPTNSATYNSDVLADAVLDIFEGKKIDGVWFQDTRIEQVGPDGKWFQQNVLADFIYDENK